MLMPDMVLGVLVGCFFCAALADLCFRRIPNFIVVTTFVLGAAYKVHEGVYYDFIIDLVPPFFILTIGFFAFRYNVLGGGDVKLLSVSGYIVGIDGSLALCVWTAVFGGVLALVMVAWRLSKMFLEIVFGQRRRKLDLGRIELPYGVAISTAAILVMVQQHGSGPLEVSL